MHSAYFFYYYYFKISESATAENLGNARAFLVTPPSVTDPNNNKSHNNHNNNYITESSNINLGNHFLVDNLYKHNNTIPQNSRYNNYTAPKDSINNNNTAPQNSINNNFACLWDVLLCMYFNQVQPQQQDVPTQVSQINSIIKDLGQ